MEPIQYPRDAGVKQVGVGAELGGEAVGGVDGRALPADGFPQRVVLAHERHTVRVQVGML